MNIIAADVGGTKTRLIVAKVDGAQDILYEACYRSNDFESFQPLLATFIHESGASANQVATLVLALPGLVSGNTAHLTNLPWVIDKPSLIAAFGIKNMAFMNDFQASVFGTAQLLQKDQVILNTATQGLDDSAGNTRVAVGAGTGLGIAWALQHGERDAQGKVISGRETLHAYDSEGGHMDFAPVDETQIRLLQFLQQRYGHVSYERILSGDGLVSLYEFCRIKNADTNPQPATQNISAEWVNKHSKIDVAADQALSLFVQIYGAYIGNIALLFKPRCGIFITGGIAAKIVNKMQSEDFINAYLNKGRMRTLVEQIAVYLVTDERIGVLGALSEAVKLQQVSR